MGYTDSTMLHIGKTPQYFFDNLLIEQVQDITKVVHSPQKLPQQLIKKDRQWESHLNFVVNGWNVLFDDITNEFKCIYFDWPIRPDLVTEYKTLYCCRADACYAVSKDGINWMKPDLDIVKRGGKRTNIILGMPVVSILESMFTFKDINDPDPQQRYKMMLYHYVTEDEGTDIILGINEKMDGYDKNGILSVEIWSSPDAIVWKPTDEKPRFGRDGNSLGDCCTIFVDEECGIYRLVTRAAGMVSTICDERRPRTKSFFEPLFPNDIGRENKRRIFQALSCDLVHWTQPDCILSPDPKLDNIDETLYGMTQIKLGNGYLGFVNVLSQVDDTMNVKLAYSRDGYRWEFLNNRQPWLETSPESWDKYMVNLSNPPIPVGNELYVYYGGASNHHDIWMIGRYENIDYPESYDESKVNYGLGLAKMRKDGYVSVDAGAAREGILITRGIWIKGNTLILNAECHEKGYIDVEVTDTQEKVLGNCTRAACDTFDSNNTAFTVTWNDDAKIPVSGPLRLRFYMKNASLYSFRFK